MLGQTIRDEVTGDLGICIAINHYYGEHRRVCISTSDHREVWAPESRIVLVDTIPSQDYPGSDVVAPSFNESDFDTQAPELTYLGQQVKDIITDAQGIVTVMVYRLGNKARACIEYFSAVKDEPVKAWFDQDRLELVP